MASRADKFTQTSKISETYSDFYDDLTVHPGNKQIVRYLNEDSIKNSIRNLILTNRYERFYNPAIGSNVRKLLFSNITPQTTSALQNAILETITNYEPRAKTIQVQVIPFPDQNYYQINIAFYVVNRSQAITLSVVLYRIR